LLIVALFGWRLASGCSSLPLALPEPSVPLSDDPPSWRRVQILVWILVALAAGPVFISVGLFLAGITYPIIVFLPSIARFARLAHLSVLIASFFRVIGILGLPSAYALTMVGLALWTLGKEGWKDLRRSLRLPKPEYFLLALGFPLAITTFSAGVWHLSPFVQFDDQTPLVLWIFFAAFFEEIMIRGLLQPRFIRRYGLLRGIFLVGIVWAAMHFFGDFSPQLNHGRVLLAIGWRLLGCVAWSFVFGWLTLRTG